MVERGKLGLAVQCLERAAALAPQQDYVIRHLGIVKARITRLPPEQRDTQVLEDSFWEGNTFDDPTVGQFLEKTDSVFLNHAVVHNVENTPNPENPNNHVVKLKGPPPKSPRVLDNLDVQPKDESPERVITESPTIGESTSEARVLDDILSNDLTELEVARMHAKKSKLPSSEQFNRSSGSAPSGSINKKTKVSAFS